MAGGRTQAGQQLSALASLQGQQMADQLGQAGSNLSGLLSGTGGQQAQSQQQLAQLLANLASQASGSVAGLGGIPGVSQTTGILESIGKTAQGVGTAMQASDRTLKENIIKVGETAKGISLYTWEWTKDALKFVGNQPTFGVIAQEVEKIIPGSVINDPRGFKVVDYSKVVAHG
jgi:hypothetical protein